MNAGVPAWQPQANGFPEALALGAAGADRSYGMAERDGGPLYKLLGPNGDPTPAGGPPLKVPDGRPPAGVGLAGGRGAGAARAGTVPYIGNAALKPGANDEKGSAPDCCCATVLLVSDETLVRSPATSPWP